MPQATPALDKSDEANLLLLALECSGRADGWPRFLAFIETALGCSTFLSEYDFDGVATPLFAEHRPGHELADLLAKVETEGGRTALQFLLSEASLLYPYCKLSLDKTNRAPSAPVSQSSGVPAALNDASGKNSPDEGTNSFDVIRNAPGLVSPIIRHERATILFACVFTDHTEDTIDATLTCENFRKILHALLPALNLFLKLRKERTNHQVSSTLLSTVRSPAILVDQNREILTHTADGLEALIKMKVVLDQGEKLTFRHKQIEKGFRLLTEKHASAKTNSETNNTAFQTDPEQLVHSVYIAGSNNALRRITLETVPQPRPDNDGTTAPWFLVRVYEPFDPPREVELLLQEQYDLSQSEARLARRLTIAGSMNATVTHLGITRNTAKTHLRRIFEKTGVNTQLQLAGLVHRLANLF